MKTWHASSLRLVFKFVLVVTAVIASAQSRIALVGSGSNLPSPVFAIWIDQFNKLDPGIQVRYLALGTKRAFIKSAPEPAILGRVKYPLPSSFPIPTRMH